MEVNINAKNRRQNTKVDNDDASWIIRSFRDVRPAHYMFKIETFSLFLSAIVESVESKAFEVGGYKWKLVLFPNGNTKKNVNDYLSLYLAIADTESLPVGWEVNVDFKLFVYDHNRDKYLVFQGGIKRFHRIKTEWGFDELLSIDTLKDTSNGYLVDDFCVFGAEVFVLKCSDKGECLSLIKNPENNIYIWKVTKLSSVEKEYVIYSDDFVVGEHKWKLKLYPEGKRSGKGKRPSVFLYFADLEEEDPLEQKVYVEYGMRLNNQVHDYYEDSFEQELDYWFSTAQRIGSGILLPSDLHDASMGFLVKDAIIIEVKFNYVSSARDL